MAEHADKRCEEKLGLAGLSMDALAVVEDMAEPLKNTTRHAPEEELLLRAVLLQIGAAGDHGLRVVAPARFSEKMKALACGDVGESLCAQATSRLLGPQAARDLFPAAVGF
jgi:hypothetical protein